MLEAALVGMHFAMTLGYLTWERRCFLSANVTPLKERGGAVAHSLMW